VSAKRKNVLICLPKLDYLPVLRLFAPAGAAYVSASLKKAGFNIFTFNAGLPGQEPLVRELDKLMSDHDISVVGCGGLVTEFAEIKKIIDAAKAIRPDAVTFIGGSLVTCSPVEAMRLIPSADIGVTGEGEITVCELIGALEAGSGLRPVKGLVIRQSGGGLTFTGPRREIADLDTVPWPDHDGFGLFDIYKDSPYGSVTTSRSCPYPCTFCAPSGGKRYRQRRLDGIFGEIDHLIGRYRIQKLSLSDELFAADGRRVLAFCERIRPYGMKWRVFLRASGAMTPALFETMREAGCESVYFGLESADDRVLQSMKKGITVSEIEHTLRLAKNAGLHTTGAFIFGDPAETAETADKTINWAFENRHILDWVTFEPIILYPGSKLYAAAVQSGKIPDAAEFIRQGLPLTNVSGLTDDQYLRLVHQVLPNANQKLREDALSRFAQTGEMFWLP
jgi:radical SAM superfamily enzyme YgiQ (UPF0313 family)